MYKVLIVDDEPVMRKGLLFFVDWDALDCVVVSEARNGFEAKDFLASKEVDIVITDIRMPGMDGIQLAEWIYENTPNIKVIILTAYADFTYAQSAVKFGVTEFITKTNPAEEIPGAVSKAQKLISLQKEKEHQLKILEGQVDEDRSEIQEKFIKDVINGIVIDKQVIDARFAEFGFPKGGYFFIVFEINRLRAEGAETDPEEQNKFLYSARSFLAQALKDYHHFTAIITKNLLFSIVIFEKDSSSSIHTQALLITCNEILAMVDNFKNFSLSIGISAMHDGMNELPQGYSEAIDALSETFYNDNNVRLYAPKPVSNEGKEILRLRKNIDDIINSIQQGNNEEASTGLGILFDEYQKNKISIEQVKVSAMLLCSLCFRLVPNYMLELPENMQFEHLFYEQIRESKSLHLLQTILNSVIESVSKLISSSKKQSNYLVIQVDQFIRENFSRYINLQQIADHVYVNSSYLSRLYKKVTGVSVIDALNKYRIDVAKEQLLHSTKKVFEIAYAVGIEDPAYFTHVFIKYVGMSPKEYKTKQLRG